MAAITFKGRPFIQNHHLSVQYHQLRPIPSKSLTKKPSIADNLIIRGDNLIALKALLPTYSGRVNCIFIDPPYNIGNEGWVYNDNVNSPMMQEWLGKVVDKEDLTRHDKWLCMMMPRIKLLKDLLHKDGAIFITIDDNEEHRLRMLMDDIFGEDNFVTNIVWQARKSVQNDTDISQAHNLLVVYAKNRRRTERRLKETNAARWRTLPGFVFRPLLLDKTKFSNPDKDPRGPWKADPFDAPHIRPNLTYEIVNPRTGRAYSPPEGRCWRVEEPKYKAYLKDKRIVFGRKGASGPQLKVFWEEKRHYGEIETTWWGDGSFESFLERDADYESAKQWSNYGTTTSGSQMLQNMFDGKKVFENPKPVELVKHILLLAAEKDSIILDSFAGSGTTGHAVLEANHDDGGSRQFILVQLPEVLKKGTPAYKMGHREVVDITADRIRRAIRGVPRSNDPRLQSPLGGTFTYIELGDPIGAEGILDGSRLPTYLDLARYVFYTATGQTFDPSKVDAKTGFIGDTRDFSVYLVYKPDLDYLRSTALTLERAKALGPARGKKRLVFAPAKYLDQEYLEEYQIEFAQLPFEIYRMRG